MENKSWYSRLWKGVFTVGRGYCAVAWTRQGLSALVLPRKSKTTALRKLASYLPPLPEAIWNRPLAKVPPQIQKQTLAALKGRGFRLSKFDITFLTPFQQRILWATCQIPWGQYRTYGWVARKAGSPRGFRAAGQALNRNPIPLFIPCHRVVASGNRLGGYGGGIDWKIRLLEKEGVAVKGGFVR